MVSQSFRNGEFSPADETKKLSTGSTSFDLAVRPYPRDVYRFDGIVIELDLPYVVTPSVYSADEAVCPWNRLARMGSTGVVY